MTHAQEKGHLGESLAYDYLKNLGYEIIGRNFHCPWGEIDIIAQKGVDIYFVEVKWRQNLKESPPRQAIDPTKLNKLEKTVEFYLQRLPNRDFIRPHLSFLGIEPNRLTTGWIFDFIESIELF